MIRYAHMACLAGVKIVENLLLRGSERNLVELLAGGDQLQHLQHRLLAAQFAELSHCVEGQVVPSQLRFMRAMQNRETIT